jgi:uncharacterized membrane protein HdeD (DUF308 family)
MAYMTGTLARNWWALGLRGLCGLLFGLAMFVWPGISLFVLVLMFGVYTLLDGVFSIVATMRSDKREKRWWLFLFQGIAGITVGIMAFVWPGITALVLLYLIAAWAIVNGCWDWAVSLRWYSAYSSWGSLVPERSPLYGSLAPIRSFSGSY